MNITFNVAPALAAVSKATGALDRKNTVPILQNVLITAPDDNKVAVYATSLDMAATATFEAEHAEPGQITVPGAMLADILKNLHSGADAKLTWDGKEPRAKLVSGRSRFSLPVLPVVDYPEFPHVEPVARLTMPAAELGALFARTAPFISTVEARRFICGVHVRITGGEVHFVSTDGFAMCRIVRRATGDDVAVTVPPAFLNEGAKAMQGSGELTLTLAPGRVGLIGPSGHFQSKTIDLAYADYGRVLVSNLEHDVSVAPEELSAAIRRATAIGEDATGLITVALSKDTMAISTRTADADAGDEIEIDYDGPEIALRFNARRLITALGGMVGEVATFGFMDERSPVILNDSGDADFTLMLMPAK